ncbi:unnamed protein product [Cercopithifilaria johnstoni]|uniref:Uncharacterized protein n=1 Tax=Cercopithifilaria johnstoni TaxID=2874296 RepID=A0A8J2LYV8_9BILA|nr:unnamed protein product [Cercopithifilaria johnstoni]
MSYTSNCDETDYFNNHWASSDSERSFPKMSSEDSSDEMDDESSDVELNVAADAKYNQRELELSGSDSELNFASNIHSADSRDDIIADEQNANKLGSEVDEIPSLVSDDFTDDIAISDNRKSEELPNEVDDEFIMKQLEKLIIRRNKKNNEARLRWLTFLREQVEAEEEAKQFEAYWERRHQEDKDLWRDKDFANAIYKMSRAGYKGKHGHFDVPDEIVQQMDALYMQITVGDYDGNKRLKCAEEWKKLQGKTKIDCQKEFIKLTNRTITMYGWNPPDGWL